MAVTVTSLSDGGRVESSWNGGGAVHLQKYDASGAPVGAEYVDTYNSNQQPQVVALSNGGYAVLVGFVFKGSTYPVYVFDAGGAKVGEAEAAGSGIGATLTASPGGGFMVVSMDQHYDGSGSSAGVDYSWRPFLTLYDNSGGVVRGPVGLSGDKPTVTVGGDGHYLVHWVDGNLTHDLNIDPANPPVFDKPATPTLTMVDDQGARTGPITGGYTNDLTPVARVSVSEVGWVEVSREPGFGDNEKTMDGGVAVTAADVARGYVDVPMDGNVMDSAPYAFYARFKDAEGVVSDAAATKLNMFKATDIWSMTDDVGPQTGAIAIGGTTDDATPTLRIGLESSGLAAGGVVNVYDGQQQVGQATLTAEDVSRGYVDITTAALPNGEHALRAWNNPTAPLKLTVAAGDPNDHQAILLDHNQTPAADGAHLANAGGNEGLLPGGSFAGQGSLTSTSYFYVSAADGVKSLTVDGHAIITDGAFSAASWNNAPNVGTIAFTGYDAATGRVDFSYTIKDVYYHSGAEQSSAVLHSDVVLTDSDGDQAKGVLDYYVYDDQGLATADTATAQVGGAAVTGNLFANDASADRPIHMYLFDGQHGDAPATVTTTHGTITANPDGSYAYTPAANAQAGTDTFNYTFIDGDGDKVSSTLTVNLAASAPSAGRAYTSPGPNSTVAGGAGDDTITASAGGDTLSGGAGADLFVFKTSPWSPAHVTDFAVGTDRLDVSAVFSAAGYGGSDPVADKVIWLQSDGAGGTQVLFDRDGAASGQQWPDYVINLEHVPSAGLTWAQLTGGAAPAATYGTVNISPASVSHAEGDSGLTAYSFTLTRSGDVSQSATTAYRVSGSGAHPVDASDLQNAAFPNVVFGWNPGEASKTITVNVVGDTTAESDETFSVTLLANSNGQGSHPTAVGPNAAATGVVVNDDGSTAGAPGQVYNSPGPNSTVTGGAGNDTLNASQGADVLTGNGGADSFAYAHLPWTHGRITDFHLGEDRLDLSGLLRDAGYTGSDPVADGYVRLTNDLGGTNTLVYFDADGQGAAHQWDGFFTTLEGVYGAGGTKGGVSTLTWAQVTGGGSSQPPPPPPPPPAADGETVTSHQYGDTLTGTSGNDTLEAGQGPDRLTGAGGADHFLFQNLPWNAGHTTDFAPGADKLDLRPLFQAYHGANPLADHWLEFRNDGNGGTQVYVDHDGPDAGDWPFLVTTLDGIAPGQVGTADWIFH